MTKMRAMVCVWLFSLSLLATNAAFALEVNIYSARKEALIKPVLDSFAAQTGITVNLVTGKADALLRRLISEGRNSPADLFLTTDAGRLHRAKQAGVLQPIHDLALTQAIPAVYRDPEGYWFGLSIRARVMVYAKDRVRPSDLSTYEALADKQWKGRICIRSSGNIYNQSLVASMIATHGVKETEQWAKGLVDNMARKPAGGDRDQVKAVVVGQCDVAVINTYYYGIMLNEDDEPDTREAAQSVALFWPNQHGRGTHVNISGAGITAHAKHKDAAVKLLRYLLSSEAQQWYADVNYEYPIRKGLPVNATLQAWGHFKADTLNLGLLGAHNTAAVMLMDRVGWR